MKANLVQESPHIIDRSDLCVVSFKGSDVGTFLQSQTCNDHTKVGPHAAQINGYCSPKGRLLALPTVASDTEGSTVYWLIPADIAEAVVKRLSMFVLRADVQISREDDWAVIGLSCDDSIDTEGQEAWLGEPESDPLTSWESNGTIGVKARSAEGVQRSLLFGPADSLLTTLQRYLEAMPADAPKPVFSGASSWTLGDIDAGVPSIVAATKDSFVPQMVNLEPLDALSFTKGCYPGQEIVARMQYLGKLKRTMVRFTASSELALSAGDSIICGDDENAGEVVSFAATDSVSHCLAVIKTSADKTAFSANGVSLDIQSLPYT